MAIRKAADPGVVEQVMGFLGDNPLTQSWQNTMHQHVIQPAENLLARDVEVERLRGLLGNYGAAGAGQIKPEVIQALDAATGEKRIGSNYQEIASKKGISNEALKSLLAGEVMGGILSDLTADQRKAVAMAASSSSNGMTDFGNVMRQYGLGSPVAAYSAVAAGGALGTKAMMDLAAYVQAEQQKQQQGQLPLT